MRARHAFYGGPPLEEAHASEKDVLFPSSPRRFPPADSRERSGAKGTEVRDGNPRPPSSRSYAVAGGRAFFCRVVPPHVRRRPRRDFYCVYDVNAARREEPRRGGFVSLRPRRG